jgi:predicted HD phosphohydrolase
MTRVAPPSTVDELLAVVEASADQTDGEAVDLLAHALQTAALLARSHPDDVELQVAGLVHDVGHVVAPGDDAGHAAIGARLVAPLLGQRVADLVTHHADAKRYLVDTDPAYAEMLSPRSRESLIAQGAAMSAEERAAFARLPDVAAVVALRRADDSAKVPGLPVAPLRSWLPALRAVTDARR